MTTYICTVAARSSQISVNLGEDKYLDMRTQLCKLVAEMTASEGHLLEGSTLCGELTDGYLHFLSTNCSPGAITSNAINSNNHSPSAIPSNTGTVPQASTNHNHGPPAMSSTTANDHNPTANAHATPSTIPRPSTYRRPSQRTPTNNHRNNSTHTTHRAIPLAAAPSSTVEEDFPADRIPPSPSDRRNIWYKSQPARDVANLRTISDVEQA